ncbi:MAG: ATP-dependent DNA helicase RecG, partial [Limisphaerales bacterium]
PVAARAGVGPERTAQLARLGVHTLGELLRLRPRRHEDRRLLRPIRELTEKGAFTARGRIVAQGVNWFRQRTKSVFEFVLDDGTAHLHCRWWNLPFLEEFYRVGDDVIVFGKLRELKPRMMDHPEAEVLEAGEEASIHVDRVVPVYPLTEGLPQRWLRALIARHLHAIPALFPPEPVAGVPAGLPATLADALRQLHAPESLEAAEAARRRLAFEEFLQLQCELVGRRRRLEARQAGRPCAGDNTLIRPFLAALPFKLTAAQTRVLREIRAGLGGRHPMRRLLQGDVGSGKTVVAACAALMALESGCEAALMAPTEILAAQHFRRFREWLAPLGVPVALRTGSVRDAGTDEAPAARPGLVIGTHALLHGGYQPGRLGLVVIDEGHKFGTAQRETLVRKGAFPHLLVLTATPIPRTLALTIYGDLDVSVLDESPPGRGRVRTFLRERKALPKVIEFLRGQLAAGRQAYVVYPRIQAGGGEEGAAEVRAAVAGLEEFQKALPGVSLGLLHGRLPAEQKDGVMQDFAAGRLRILVATSVIEVGVDVANATVMLIENAERFGLAQPHQLRGRIGRGAHESFCVLLHHGEPETAARLQVLVDTTDGFRIAEEDLAQRGAGDLAGLAQSGASPFRFGDLATDRELVEAARAAAEACGGDAPSPAR